MKKHGWLALALALGMVLSCGSGALAAFDADSVTVEAVAEANGRDVIFAAHESVRMDYTDLFSGPVTYYTTKEYQYIRDEEEHLFDAVGEWVIIYDDSGRDVLLNWEALDYPDNTRVHLTRGPVISVDLLLTETLEAVRDNGDGTLTLTIVQEPGSFAEYLEANDATDPDVPEDAACRTDVVVDAETLEIRSYEDYGLRADGERMVVGCTDVTYDVEAPETAEEIRAASAAFRAGAPENPRTITVIYDYGTDYEEQYSIVADRSFKVLPFVYYGYVLHYFDPERLTVASAGSGLSDRTLYVFRSGAYLYEHDPRLNPRVLEDAVADESAVYGFRPSETGSLAMYADADWTDPAMVAAGRAERIAYHESLQSMYDVLEEMRAEGADIETIARTVSAMRNELRMAACSDEEELAALKARNLEKYGHEEGPQADELYAKYGSWEIVLTKAFSPNAAMDACLGLYDDYYDLYLTAGWLSEESEALCERQYAVAAFVDSFYPWVEDTEKALGDFADAGEIEDCYVSEWEWAIDCGLVKGYEDGTLRPAQTIRRIEAFVLLSRCLSELEATGEAVDFSDVPDWAKDDIDRLSAAGLLRGYGDGTLGAEDALTVEQVYTILERAGA